MTPVFVAGLFAVSAAILGSILGYRLGRRRSRYEKQAEVLVELRKMSLVLKDHFVVFSVPPEPGTTKLEQINAMEPGIDEMRVYFHFHDVYLKPELRNRVRWTVGRFLQHFMQMRDALRANASNTAHTAPHFEDLALQKMETWMADELTEKLEELEDEIRRILDTHETLWDLLALYGR